MDHECVDDEDVFNVVEGAGDAAHQGFGDLQTVRDHRSEWVDRGGGSRCNERKDVA